LSKITKVHLIDRRSENSNACTINVNIFVPKKFTPGCRQPWTNCSGEVYLIQHYVIKFVS